MSNTKRGAADDRLSLVSAAEVRFMLSEELAGKRLLMLSKGYVPLPSTGKKVPLLGWSNLDADSAEFSLRSRILIAGAKSTRSGAALPYAAATSSLSIAMSLRRR
jgi:hypothetical protein